MPDTRVPGRRCGSPRYDCSSDGRQVPLAYQCDGQPDCPNGEDEINCSKFPRLWDPLQSSDPVLDAPRNAIPNPLSRWSDALQFYDDGIH